MKLITVLKLGRISNLPTIWTNVFVGVALSGVAFNYCFLLLPAIAISFVYLAGMYFNDIFDAEWDVKHNQPRPIALGEATISEVRVLGCIWLALAFLILLFASPVARLIYVLPSAFILVALIMLYDWKHKHWADSGKTIGPWVMGACRMWVYFTVAAMLGAWNWQLLAAGVCLCVYIAGITYVAKSEHLNELNHKWPLLLLLAPYLLACFIAYNDVYTWLFVALGLLNLYIATGYLKAERRNVPLAVGSLLAGITLVDASLLMALGYSALALVALAACGLCLVLQRYVSAS